MNISYTETHQALEFLEFRQVLEDIHISNHLGRKKIVIYKWKCLIQTDRGSFWIKNDLETIIFLRIKLQQFQTSYVTMSVFGWRFRF